MLPAPFHIDQGDMDLPRRSPTTWQSRLEVTLPGMERRVQIDGYTINRCNRNTELQSEYNKFGQWCFWCLCSVCCSGWHIYRWNGCIPHLGFSISIWWNLYCNFWNYNHKWKWVATFGGVVTAFAHGSGTVQFTNTAAAQTIYATNQTHTLTFYNLIVAKTAQTLGPYATDLGCHISCANNLTVTSGIFTTKQSLVSFNLTVTAVTSITGTLTCNASTISLGSTRVGGPASTDMAVLLESGGTLTGGTGANHTYGSIWCKVGSSWTATSGTTTINGSGCSDGTGYAFVLAGTWRILQVHYQLLMLLRRVDIKQVEMTFII